MPKSNKTELSKQILSKMTPNEHKTLKQYEKICQTLGEKMVKYQCAYSQYMRKTNDKNSVRAQKMADKGFEFEGKAFKAHHVYVKYTQHLRNKYASTAL
jgi:hypothetical protein